MFWFLWIVVLLCAVWVALGSLPAGADAHMPLPYLIALIPLLWVPLLATAVAANVMREWGLLCGAIAVGLASQMRESAYWAKAANGFFGVRSGATGDAAARSHDTMRETRRETEINSRETAREILDQQRTATASHASFRVMTLNCRYGRADAKSIVGAVLSRNVTVLALQELTMDLVDDLNRNGLDALLPYRQLGDGKETDNGGFNGIWIRVEPQSSRASAVEIPAADVPSITIPVDSMRDITFASAHPKSPMRGSREWSAGIRGLGALATDAKQRDRDIAVVLGDLNSGLDHPSFRALLKAGFTDANLDVAQGPRRTFPRWVPWPRIVLDHVLATAGARFTDVESFEIERTDHLALAATLAI
ncbi:endonuclease [Bifidobacterium ramosum]|uniref:Endonuclease n=1 Tax=Bifidobacterium ramosum TaxID=1798158 RepID=A0A6L4X268_9BIFI|nr:endonuclease/exonuclease/phosphatase family protein [Bifidobacterium ramosum]KAB8288714.1 endonuclease [Bifidobacterium ramosum]NEG71422.1 endonuclease/exonuclease/phosphatase family protein [Bifidobacterium ramosum]